MQDSGTFLFPVVTTLPATGSPGQVISMDGVNYRWDVALGIWLELSPLDFYPAAGRRLVAVSDTGHITAGGSSFDYSWLNKQVFGASSQVGHEGAFAVTVAAPGTVQVQLPYLLCIGDSQAARVVTQIPGIALVAGYTLLSIAVGGTTSADALASLATLTADQKKNTETVVLSCYTNDCWHGLDPELDTKPNVLKILAIVRTFCQKIIWLGSPPVNLAKWGNPGGTLGQDFTQAMLVANKGLNDWAEGVALSYNLVFYNHAKRNCVDYAGNDFNWVSETQMSVDGIHMTTEAYYGMFAEMGALVPFYLSGITVFAEKNSVAPASNFDVPVAYSVQWSSTETRAYNGLNTAAIQELQVPPDIAAPGSLGLTVTGGGNGIAITPLAAAGGVANTGFCSVSAHYAPKLASNASNGTRALPMIDGAAPNRYAMIGCHFVTGTGFVAEKTSAALVGVEVVSSVAQLVFYENTGLTAGVAFTPTRKATFPMGATSLFELADSNGLLRLSALCSASTGTSGWLMGCRFVDGTGYVALASDASVIITNATTHALEFYYNASLTIGATFTPTKMASFFASSVVPVQPVALATGSTAVTQAAGDNSTKIANTAFVVAFAAAMAVNTATAANNVWAGPTTGAAAAPSFRALVATDIPALTSAKISDFDTQVRTSRLDQMAVPTADVSFNGHKLTNLGTPTASTDAVTKAYADNLVTGLWDDRGSYDASVNTFPASGGSGAAGAVLKGDIWTVSVAGTLGGTAVQAGDLVRALADAPGQTAGNWALSEHDLGYTPLSTAQNLADLGSAPTARTNLGGTTVGQAFFTLANPSAITFPRINADNSVTARSAANYRTDLGLDTMATQAANNVAITGGAIDGTPVGATTKSTGAFTTLTATGAVTFTTASGTVLSLGNTTDASSASPVVLSMGGTYSDTAGQKPKLRLYDNGSTFLGFGFSLNQFDYIGVASGRHAFWNGTTKAVLFSNTALNGNSATLIGWTSSSTDAGGTVDIALARNAAGTVEINNGTAGTLRDLTLRTLTTSGDATVGANTGTARNLSVNSAAGNLRALQFLTAGVLRHSVTAGAGAESGSNAGSAFGVNAYDDSGALIDQWLNVTRASAGAIAFGGSSNRPITHTGALTLSTAGKALTLAACTAGGSGQIIFTSGTKLTTAVAGVREFDGTHYETKSNAIRYASGGVLFDHFADAGNTTTTETDLYSDSIAANTLDKNGHKLDAEYACTLVNSTSTKQVRAYFAGTLIFDTGALTISASSEIVINVLIIRDSSTTIRYSVTANLTGASTGSYANVGKLTGLTLSNANTLKITGQAAAVGAATNDIVATAATIRFEPGV